MKIALLHLDLSGGPEQRNLDLICKGINQAAQNGAKWIITPEMAVQGYFFTQMGREYIIPSNIENDIQQILELAKRLKIFIFLGCAEQSLEDGKPYNSCLVIDDEGEIIGRHHKMKIISSKTESWATAGEKLETIKCDGLNVGILVCSDAWVVDNGIRLGVLSPDLIVLVAAWPPGCGALPTKTWENCSKLSGGRPIIVCNQTGTTRGLNCFIAESATIIDGKMQASYQGNASILLIDFCLENKVFLQSNFTILPLGK